MLTSKKTEHCPGTCLLGLLALPAAAGSLPAETAAAGSLPEAAAAGSLPEAAAAEPEAACFVTGCMAKLGWRPGAG